jgi:hypothetical protein
MATLFLCLADGFQPGVCRLVTPFGAALLSLFCGAWKLGVVDQSQYLLLETDSPRCHIGLLHCCRTTSDSNFPGIYNPCRYDFPWMDLRREMMLIRRVHAGCLIFFMLAFIGPTALAKNDPGETIKQRSQQFYTFLKNNQMGEASKLLVKAQRGSLNSGQQNSLLDFKVGEIRLEKDNKSALVQMFFTMPMPMMPKPVMTERWMRWTLEGGKWCLDLEGSPKTVADHLDGARDRMYARMQKNSKEPPLKIKIEKTSIDLGRVTMGKLETVRFPFVNQYDQELKIEKVFAPTDFFKDLTETRLIKPGDKGEIVLEFDPSKGSFDFESTILVEFEPVNELLPLTVKADIRPPAPAKK